SSPSDPHSGQRGSACSASFMNARLMGGIVLCGAERLHGLLRRPAASNQDMSSPVESPPRSRGARIVALILPRVALYPLLAASLLVFPAWLPWMILCWIAVASLRRARGKTAWPALGICVGIVLWKRMDWPPSLIVLGM